VEAELPVVVVLAMDSSGGWCGKTFIMGSPAEVPKYRPGQVLNC